MSRELRPSIKNEGGQNNTRNFLFKVGENISTEPSQQLSQPVM